ncbi:MAG: DUF485 domain-containing protein [Gammaproteobacteria bacterium]|nr:DUF485 domain-containing protein [Gammaproteobacteria bacterium]
MDETTARRITSSPEYQALVGRRSRFAWTLALIPAVLLVGFLACLAWAPGFMGRPAWGVFSVGMLWGLIIIAAGLAITWWYLHHSENVFEPAQRELFSRLKQRT